MKLLHSLKNIILEQESDLESEYAKSIVKSTPFNISAAASCEAMKSSLESNDIPFASVGKKGKIKLPGVDEMKKFKSDTQQRFVEWYSNVITNPDSYGVRGKIFEGLIGGVFGGEVTGNEMKSGEERSDKTDVRVGNLNISVKFRQAGEFMDELPMGSIQLNVKSEVDKINGDTDRTLYSQEEINSLNRILVSQRLPVVSKLNKDKITAKKILEVLRGNEGGKKFIKRVLDDSAFKNIQYFMGGKQGDLNEIRVLQFETKKIIENILLGNFKMIGNTIAATNLQNTDPKTLVIEFPQYVKTKRIKYKIDDKSKKNYFIGEKPTIGSLIKRSNEVVGYVRRKFVDDKLTYTVDSYGVKLEDDLKSEAINKTIMSDIRNIQKIQTSGELESLKKQMIDQSNLESKKLFTTKSKIGSDKSRDYGLSKIIGGSREETLSPAVVKNIRKNPDRFLQRFLDLYKDDPQRVSKFMEIIRNTIK